MIDQASGKPPAWAKSAEGSSSEPEMIQIHFAVPAQFDGWRLDQFIKARIPRLSRNRIQKMIHAQSALGQPALRPAQRVRASQEILLLRPAPDEPDVPRTFSILYQDQHIMAINKPAGLPVHATARFHKNTLTTVLREQFSDGFVPSLAHRLDRETSGILLLGLTRQDTVRLKQTFRLRQVQKRYLAIVHGIIPDQGTLDFPLAPDTLSGIRIKMAVDPGGLPALTRFRRLDRRGPYSLVEVFPKTGRQHQIRVHFAAIGHPLLGDKLYGQEASTWLEFIAQGWTPRLQELLLLPRQALHAASVEFPHPASGQRLQLCCPLAEDLRLFWAEL